jgi:hypothetical protein
MIIYFPSTEQTLYHQYLYCPLALTVFIIYDNLFSQYRTNVISPVSLLPIGTDSVLIYIILMHFSAKWSSLGLAGLNNSYFILKRGLKGDQIPNFAYSERIYKIYFSFDFDVVFSLPGQRLHELFAITWCPSYVIKSYI